MLHKLILNELKKSPLGIFYKKKLKRYLFLRVIFNYIFWRIAYLSIINVNFFFLKSKKILPLNTSFNFEIIEKILSQNKFKIKIKTQNFFHYGIKKLLSTNAKIQNFKIYNLENIKIIKNSDFFFSKNKIFHHEFYDFKKDYTSEELHGLAKFSILKNTIKFIDFDKNLYYPKGAVFTHSCSNNFFHWMSEVLPRINLFCKIKKYKDYPIFIDDKLDKNILRSLKITLNKGRKIIFVKEYTNINIKKAIYVNPLSYVPFEPRNFFSGVSYNAGLMDQYSLYNLRNKILKEIKPKNKIKYKKIYLDRDNSTYRSILNYDQVKNYYKRKGYKMIRMEKLSFDDQVYIFSNANFIAGPTGASFGNLIFSKKNAKITILIPKNYHTLYFLWANYSRFLNINMNIIACGNKNRIFSFFSKMHTDFYVNTNNLKI